jgi:diguanylate cyclase (GGDEF)-like protein
VPFVSFAQFVQAPRGVSAFFSTCAASAACVALVLANTTHALPVDRALSEYVHVTWSVDSGLPQSTVRAVVQTRDGYIWLATHEGLARFDGRQFAVFNETNTPALRGNGISALFASETGALWIGLRDDGVVRLFDGKFSALESPGVPKGAVSALKEDSTGQLWVGTSSGGLGIVNLKDPKSTRVVTTKEGLPHNGVVAIDVADAGGLSDKREVYVGTSRGLAIFRGGELIREHPLPEFSVNPITAIHRDKRGGIWIGVAKLGLFHRPAAAADGPLASWQRFTSREGVSDQISRISSDREGAVWIGTLEGLQRLYQGRVETLTTSQGLTSNYVRDLLEDAEGNLWVGTESGLDRYRDGLINVWDASRGLTEEFTRTVMEDRTGNVWVGTSNGLFRFRDGKFTRFAREQGLVSNAVLSLAEDADGAVWVGTNSGGLHAFKDGTLNNIGASLGLEALAVRAIMFARDRTVWVGTPSGVVRSTGSGLGSARTFGAADGLKSDQVHAIVEDADGTVWIGGRRGAQFVKPSADVMKDLTFESLPGVLGTVFSIMADGETMYFTTSRGLFARHRGRVVNLSEETGLPARGYFQILSGDDKTLWLCSNHGIVSIARDALAKLPADSKAAPQLRPKFFDRADGMLTSQCNGSSQPAGWRAASGKLLFPTAKGVAIYDTSRMIAMNQRPPPVHITAAIVDGESLKDWAKIDLPPGTRRIEFRFVGLSYVDPSRVKYRYQLEGFDEDWVDAGGEQRATFTNVPTGTFRFRVNASNNDGVWNDVGAAVEVTQHAPFYEKRSFYVILLLLIAAIAYAAYLTRVRALARQSAQLQRLVDERTRDLSAQKDALQRANDDKAALLVKIQEQSEAFEEMSKIDPLTGIANRRELDRALSVEWQRAARSGSPLSVVIGDLDFFKQVNDEHSHAVGDAVLKELATLLVNGRRNTDVVARYGGEEFVLVLPDTERTAASQLAERLRQRVEVFDWSIIQPGLRVTISFGVASREELSADSAPERLVMAADDKLYRAKGAGRNRVIS